MLRAEEVKPNLVLRFSIPGMICGVNQAYIRAKFSPERGPGGGSGLVLSKRGRQFKDRVRDYALAARQRQEWPSYDSVRACEVTIVVYNCPHDVQAPDKLVLDAMQKVIYKKDSVVEWVHSGRPKDSTGTPRMDITIELLQYEAELF